MSEIGLTYVDENQVDAASLLFASNPNAVWLSSPVFEDVRAFEEQYLIRIQHALP